MATGKDALQIITLSTSSTLCSAKLKLEDICDLLAVDITDAMKHLLDLDVRAELIPRIADSLLIANIVSSYPLDSCLTGNPQPVIYPKELKSVGPVVFLVMVNEVAAETPYCWKYVDDITAAVGDDIRADGETPGLHQTMNRISV